MSTDILVSFDSTGSMSPILHQVRQRLTDSVDKLFDNIPGLRMGVISHGDYCDGPKMVSHIPFTTSREEVKRFIKSAPNTSGGDGDEFYEYILHFAQQYDWQGENRVFVMIADADPHKVGYRYDGITYNYDWETEAQLLATHDVNIYAVQALSRYSNKWMERIAYLSNGRKLELQQFSDAVETLVAIGYHKVGKLEEYRQELETTFRMNRNLAQLLGKLDVEVKNEVFTKADKSGLVPVSPSRFQMVTVDRDIDIKSFVESIGARFRIGRGFYQFTKSEMIQERKEVILRNKVTGDMFTGDEAREYIGLPFGKRGQLRPGYFTEYEVYVQSTSSNRKLMHNTKFLYENEYWS